MEISFTDLPIDVMQLIVDLGGLSALIGTNRHFFFDVRRHLYLRLNREYSLKYYREEAFRAQVHSRKSTSELWPEKAKAALTALPRRAYSRFTYENHARVPVNIKLTKENKAAQSCE